MIELSSIINDEQLLDFALSHICEKNSDEVHEVAEQIVMVYIINHHFANQDFTEEDVHEKYSELICSYVLTNLVKKDMLCAEVKEDGEIVYNITEEGRKRINNG